MVIRFIFLICACVSVAACGRESAEVIEKGTLYVGVLPDQDREELLAVHEPLIDYLEGALGQDFELVLHSSYEELVDAFVEGEVQLAWFGGFTFVQARERSGAVPIATRDVDMKFGSIFLVPTSSQATSLEDFRGARFSFASKFSTSGHLMPRFFLEEDGMVPETFFGEVQYASNHDEAIRRVGDGEADLAVASSVIVKKKYRNQRLESAGVRVLKATPQYQNYVWAAHPDLCGDTCEELLNAFLALDLADPEHQLILTAQEASGYLPAHGDDFDAIERIAKRHGLLAGKPSP